MSAALHDLSRKLQLRLGEVVEREATIAQHVLTTGEVSIMLMEAAVALSLTAAATIAASMGDLPPDEAFDRTLACIAAMAASERARLLGKVAAKREAPRP